MIGRGGRGEQPVSYSNFVLNLLFLSLISLTFQHILNDWYLHKISVLSFLNGLSHFIDFSRTFYWPCSSSSLLGRAFLSPVFFIYTQSTHKENHQMSSLMWAFQRHHLEIMLAWTQNSSNSILRNCHSIPLIPTHSTSRHCVSQKHVVIYLSSPNLTQFNPLFNTNGASYLFSTNQHMSNSSIGNVYYFMLWARVCS